MPYTCELNHSWLFHEAYNASSILDMLSWPADIKWAFQQSIVTEHTDYGTPKKSTSLKHIWVFFHILTRQNIHDILVWYDVSYSFIKVP